MSRCEIQIAYAIGVLEPVSISVETFGTETADPAKIETALRDIFDLRPGIIVQRPAASLRTPGLDLWITRSTNRRFPGSLWIKLGLTVCHLIPACAGNSRSRRRG